MTTTKTPIPASHQVDIDLRTWQYDDRIILARQMYKENGQGREAYLEAIIDYVEESIGYPGPSRLALHSLVVAVPVCMLCSEQLATVRAEVSWREGGRSCLRWPICDDCNHPTEDYTPYEIEVI
jgi:hypothetical protein